MRLPRFTTRRLMVLVAVVALAFEAERLLRWRAHCLMKAEVHADRANDFISGLTEVCFENETPGMRGRLQRHWTALAEKYRRAARYPWLPVAPDPPPPR